MAKSEEKSIGDPTGQKKRRIVRNPAPSEYATSYPEHVRRCFTTVTPDGQPPFEFRFSTTALPDLTEDMRQQEEYSHPGVPEAWTNSFRSEPAALPVWKSFWEFAYPRVLVMKSTKMYLANERCFQDMLSNVLASALWFAAPPSDASAGGAAGDRPADCMKLRGEAELDGCGYSGNADFVFSSRDGGIKLIVETKRSNLSYYQNAKQLWKQMLAASEMNRRRGVSTPIIGILQDQEGAVAFRLVAEHSAPGATSTSPHQPVPADAGVATSDGRATQLDMPSGYASGSTPPAPLEASISCSPYMAVLSSDGRPAFGIAAWTMLLISSLYPGCAQWTVEQAAQRVEQLADRAKREHDSFYAQLDRATTP